jgi:hypothetical protein
MSLAKEFQEVIGEVRAKLRLTKEDNQEGLIRLSGTADYTLAVLEGVNPYLCRPEDFNGLASHLQLIVTALRKFIETTESPYVEEANRQMDGALEYLSKILPKQPKAVFRDLPKVIQDVTSRVVDHKKFEAVQRIKIGDSTTALCEEVGALKEAQEQEIEALRTSFEASKIQFEKDWETLELKLTQLQTTQTAGLSASFDEAETELQTKWKTLQQTYEQQWTTRSTDHTAKLRALLDGLKDTEDEVLDRFQVLEKKVTDIVGVTGSAAMAGAFHNIGLAEEGRANRYQRFADYAWVGLVIVALAVLIEGTIHYYLKGTLFPGGVASIGPRLFVSLSIAALSGYMMRQAEKHRAAERWAKQLSAEISSMGAFLAPLEEEQQKAVRVAVALRIFGQASDREGRTKAGEDNSLPLPAADGLSKVLGQVLEFARLSKDGK